MRNSATELIGLVGRLQRLLPIPAHATPELAVVLRRWRPNTMSSSACIVTGVFDAGKDRGIMCVLKFSGTETDDERATFIAPIRQVAFGRRSAMGRELSAYRKRSPCSGYSAGARNGWQAARAQN